MRVAALILGLLGGLSGLSFAAYAGVALWAFGAVGMAPDQVMLGKLLIWGLPLAAFLGGGVALSQPGASAFILFISAAGYLLIANWVGTSFFTMGTMILNGAGGFLALLAAGSAESTPQVQIQVHDAEPSPTSPKYDRAKWEALVKYDPDISKVATKLAALGPHWVHVFAADCLVLNDKSYLPEIVNKIIADAKERERQEDSRRRLEEKQAADAAAFRAKAEAERLAEEERRAQARRDKGAAIKRFFFGSALRTTATILALLILFGSGAGSYYLYQQHLAYLAKVEEQKLEEARALRIRLEREERERQEAMEKFRLEEQQRREAEERQRIDAERKAANELRMKRFAAIRSSNIHLSLRRANIHSIFNPQQYANAIEGYNFDIPELNYKGLVKCAVTAANDVYKPQRDGYTNFATRIEFDGTHQPIRPQIEDDFQVIRNLLDKIRDTATAQCEQERQRGNVILVEYFRILGAASDLPTTYEVRANGSFNGSSVRPNAAWDLQLDTAAASATPASTQTTISGPSTSTYSDPFAYCRAVGDDDYPGSGNSRYKGPDNPPAVTSFIRASNQSYQWRCMDRNVYACFTGASGRACTVIQTSRMPTPGIKDFCLNNPNHDFIPYGVIGYTVHEWRCMGNSPIISKTMPASIDRRGFTTDTWQLVSQTTTTQLTAPRSLPAPTLVSPDANAEFDIFPRTTILRWNPVAGATEYQVEVQYKDEHTPLESWFAMPGLPNPLKIRNTGLRFNFVGKQHGRWRVTAVDGTGNVGQPSQWRVFNYLR